MRNYNFSDDDEASPDLTESQSSSSERSNRSFQFLQQYSSDENNSIPSFDRSLPKATKTVNKTKEVPQSHDPSLTKDHRIPPKHVSHAKNGHDKYNYIADEKKEKYPKIQLKSLKYSDSPRSDHSYKELYLFDSRQERFAEDSFDNYVQCYRDLKGRTEERRVPAEPKKPKQDSVCKESRGEYKGVVHREDFVKNKREERRKDSPECFNFSGETSEILKILAQKKWKDHIEFSDISETVSEICYRDDSTKAQSGPMKSKSALKDQRKMPSDQFGSKGKKLDDLMSRLTDQLKTSNNQRKRTEDVAVHKKGRNEEFLRLMEQLKKFPLKELRITKKGDFDVRSQLTHIYLDLCKKADQDPLDFYYKNCSKDQHKIVKNVEESHQRNKLKVASDDERDPPEFNQSDYSDELSYKSAESDDDENLKKSTRKLQQQLENEQSKEEMRKKKALEDLEKFNYAAIEVTKEGRMSLKFKEEKAKLYFKFCKDADVHPIEYYRKTGKKSISKENLEERIKTLLESDGFEIDDLVFTKQGLPSRSSTSRAIKNWLVKYGYYDET